MIRTPITQSHRYNLVGLPILFISITLHALVWYLWQDLPKEQPKPIVPPPEKIEVALVTAPKSKPAQAAPPPTAVAQPKVLPKQEKPKPQKIEKVKPKLEKTKPKPKPVAKPIPAPMPKPVENVVDNPEPIAPPTFTKAASAPNSTPSSKAKSVQPSASPVGESFEKAVYSSPSLHNPPTHYPRIAQSRNWEGKVTLEVRVLANGTAGDIKVVQSSGHDLLDEAAVTQVKAWRFIPAHKGGKTVDDWVRVPINFKLKH